MRRKSIREGGNVSIPSGKSRKRRSTRGLGITVVAEEEYWGGKKVHQRGEEETFRVPTL